MRLPNSIRILPVLLTSFFAVEARAGLIAFYNFDEGSGTVANDSVGSVDGTLTGNAAFVGGGITGGAISLDKDGYVTMGDNFNFAGDFSIQTWVKLASGDTTAENPVARHWATVAAGYFIAINDVGDGCSAVGKAHFYAGYPCSGDSAISVNDGEWHQIVGTYQASGGIRSIYVDGQLQASTGGSAMIQASAPFVVGGIKNPAGTDIVPTYSGLEDNVGVWDSVLSGSEVQALYETTLAGDAPEPGTLTLLMAAGGLLAAYSRRRW